MPKQRQSLLIFSVDDLTMLKRFQQAATRFPIVLIHGKNPIRMYRNCEEY